MIKNFSLVLLVVCTLFVVFLKPKLHKTVLFSEPITKQEQIEFLTLLLGVGGPNET